MVQVERGIISISSLLTRPLTLLNLEVVDLFINLPQATPKYQRSAVQVVYRVRAKSFGNQSQTRRVRASA
jgi:hypothetical protein